MATARNARLLRIIPLVVAICLIDISVQAQTSRYIFLPGQSTLVQTGGIASVQWTYAVQGQFLLAVDSEAGTASFTQVDANAADDSPLRHTLDPNEVFNMTALAGTVVDGGTSIRFEGSGDDASSILITLTFADGTVTLKGQTTPPPVSADFFIFALDAVARLKYSGGSGTADDPYQIATAEDLILLGENPEDYDKHFIMTDNINLDPNQVFGDAVIAPATGFWPDNPPIGTPFSGVFDGAGHAIRNLVISEEGAGTGLLGLFGLFGSYFSTNPEIKNLGLENISVSGANDSDYIGGLCGWNGGSITNCYVNGTVTGGDNSNSIGGLCGWNNGYVTFYYLGRGKIISCHSAGMVSGYEVVGGLCGSNNGSIINCYSISNTSGTSLITSGLCGRNLDYGSIIHCYSAGTVTGGGSIGGLCGWNYGCISHCYSTSTVNNEDRSCYVGGLCARNDGCISHCYSTSTIHGNEYIGGLCGHNNGSISKCHSTGAVISGGSYPMFLGGLCGDNFHGSIKNSYSTGEVIGGRGSKYLGGLCGRNYSNWIVNRPSSITNCYSTGAVNGRFDGEDYDDNYLGGLCGLNDGSDSSISNCYSTGIVTAGGRYDDDHLGGLCGDTFDGSIINCYYLDIADHDNGFGTPLSDTKMKQQSSFVGWDFIYETENGVADIWSINEEIDYPMLLEERTVWFPDYVPLDPNTHGIKTFEWILGSTGTYTSEIGNSEIVPYTSGPLEGVQITNYSNWGWPMAIMSNDGISVKFLGTALSYVSTDTSLSSHPSTYSFTTLENGDIIDVGTGTYWVHKDMSAWENYYKGKMLLIDVQDVTVPAGSYDDSVIMWWLDMSPRTYYELDFYEKDSEMGITLPSKMDTAGNSITEFEIYAPYVGLIAHGRISTALSGLKDLAVLKEVSRLSSTAK